MTSVKLFANLRKIAGTKEVFLTARSVRTIISELVTQVPALANHLHENGQIRPYIIITINGHPTADLDAPVNEQDEIAVFPPITGG